MAGNYITKKLKTQISNGGQKQVLKAFQQVFKEQAMLNEIIVLKNRLNKINNDYRIGLLSYEDHLVNTSKIDFSILKVIDEIEQDPELLALMRQFEKKLLFSSYVNIFADISEFIPGKVLQFKASQFIDIDDFLNELYFKIKDFVKPGTFRKEWVVDKIDPASKEKSTISDAEINNLINKEYPFGERAYSIDETNKIRQQNDVLFWVRKIN